jgi:hypothetical protein
MPEENNWTYLVSRLRPEPNTTGTGSRSLHTSTLTWVCVPSLHSGVHYLGNIWMSPVRWARFHVCQWQSCLTAFTRIWTPVHCTHTDIRGFKWPETVHWAIRYDIKATKCTSVYASRSHVLYTCYMFRPLMWPSSGRCTTKNTYIEMLQKLLGITDYTLKIHTED